MKQRMLNTFTRKFKIKVLAKICTEIGYFILNIYYLIVSVFLKKKSGILIDDTTVQRAKNIVSSTREKPNMDCGIINFDEEDMVDLSIIIPAYNVEKYIRNCLQSVLKQKTKYHYEVIVVNDGATDNTDALINEIKNEKVNYIIQKNQGLSGARNTGLNVAKGKYVTFVDSDDVLEEDSIESMMDAITEKDADVVVGSHYTFCEDSNVKQYHINTPRIIENNSSEAVKNPGYAWGKIYKRTLFEKIRFPMDAWYEDTLICSLVYRMCKKMVIIDDVVYGYRINPKGISQTARSSVKALDHYWVMEDVLKKAEKIGLKNDSVLYDIVFNHMSTFLFRRTSLLPDEIVKSVFVLACDMLNKIRPEGYQVQGKKMRRDLEEAFQTGNYKLWRVASFLI